MIYYKIAVVEREGVEQLEMHFGSSKRTVISMKCNPRLWLRFDNKFNTPAMIGRIVEQWHKMAAKEGWKPVC